MNYPRAPAAGAKSKLDDEAEDNPGRRRRSSARDSCPATTTMSLITHLGSQAELDRLLAAKKGLVVVSYSQLPFAGTMLTDESPVALDRLPCHLVRTLRE